MLIVDADTLMFALVNNSQIFHICSSRREQQYAKHLNTKGFIDGGITVTAKVTYFFNLQIGVREEEEEEEEEGRHRIIHSMH